MTTSTFKVSSYLWESGRGFERDVAPEGCDDNRSSGQLIKKPLLNDHNKSPSVYSSFVAVGQMRHDSLCDGVHKGRQVR